MSFALAYVAHPVADRGWTPRWVVMSQEDMEWMYSCYMGSKSMTVEVEDGFFLPTPCGGLANIPYAPLPGYVTTEKEATKWLDHPSLEWTTFAKECPLHTA